MSRWTPNYWQWRMCHISLSLEKIISRQLINCEWWQIGFFFNWANLGVSNMESSNMSKSRNWLWSHRVVKSKRSPANLTLILYLKTYIQASHIIFHLLWLTPKANLPCVVYHTKKAIKQEWSAIDSLLHDPGTPSSGGDVSLRWICW